MKRLLELLRRRTRDERGAALIFVAIGLPVFVAFGIFVVDVGNWWVHKRHLQTQADAAALAGAREFRFPTCSDKDIVEEAVDYSGGTLADPDVNYASFDSAPLNYNYQLAANARPAGPTQAIHTQVNTPDPYNRAGDGSPVDADLAAMTVANRKPCKSQMIDVKMTETDIAGRFSPLRFLDVLGFVDFIDARARVTLSALESTSGLLPLGVEDLNPKRVHVWVYDEDTSVLLGEAELKKQAPLDGLLMYDNSVAGGGVPISIDMKRQTIGGLDVTKQRLGVKVAVSGTDSITCGDALVECYGTASNGLTRVRGHRAREGTTTTSCTDGIDNDGDANVDNNDPECRSVRLGDVALIKDAAFCAANTFGAHDNGYFSTTCTKEKLVVDMPGFNGVNEQTNQMNVTAKIEYGNGTHNVALHWVALDSRWETTGNDRLDIDLAKGTRKIDIAWEQRKNTLDMGGATPVGCLSNNNNTCLGTFTNVHKAFSGDRPLSGPIKELRVDVDGILNVNNVARCATAQTCLHDFVVRIGMAGRLELSPPNAPPVALRISASGPEVFQTQQLNCDPGYSTTDDELAFGCRPGYKINTGTSTCPKRPALWAQPNPPPWDCVAVKTGTVNGPVSKGINERVLCQPPNSAGNCTGFGKPQACTNPNHYPDYSDGDPRILALFLVPFGSLDISGADETVPVTDFAYFYITGWHSKGGGFDNPCDKPGQNPPDIFAPGTDPNDGGVVSGYFIKYVAPNLGGGGSAPCNPDTIGGCVAVMTK